MIKKLKKVFGTSFKVIIFIIATIIWSLFVYLIDGEWLYFMPLIAGDVLFNGSIGRTDLPQGNHQDLIDSIHNHLLVLDDSYIVHCGHVPDTSIGHERKTNPFLNA